MQWKFGIPYVTTRFSSKHLLWVSYYFLSYRCWVVCRFCSSIRKTYLKQKFNILLFEIRFQWVLKLLDFNSASHSAPGLRRTWSGCEDCHGILQGSVPPPVSETARERAWHLHAVRTWMLTLCDCLAYTSASFTTATDTKMLKIIMKAVEGAHWFTLNNDGPWFHVIHRVRTFFILFPTTSVFSFTCVLLGALCMHARPFARLEAVHSLLHSPVLFSVRTFMEQY